MNQRLALELIDCLEERTRITGALTLLADLIGHADRSSSFDFEEGPQRGDLLRIVAERMAAEDRRIAALARSLAPEAK